MQAQEKCLPRWLWRRILPLTSDYCIKLYRPFGDHEELRVLFGQLLPDGFRHEWHERVEELERDDKGPVEQSLSRRFCGRISVFQYRLRLLKDFRGETIPYEVVNSVCGEIETEFFDVLRRVLREFFGFREQFLIRFSKWSFGIEINRIFQNESRDVPHFISEMLIAPHTIFCELRIGARRSADDKAKPRRVSAVFIHHIQWIDDVTERFRHLPALAIAHEPEEIALLEVHLSYQKSRHEYQACDPEKYNVVARLEHSSRMIGLQIGCFFRPPERGKGPETR